MLTPRGGAGRPQDPDLVARRQTEILEVATRVFAQFGYRNADVQTIADVLKVGKGTIYRYFPSKKELFFAAVDRGMKRFVERITAEADKFTDPLERIGGAVYGYLSYFDEHPDLVELLIQERAEFRDREKPSYFMHRDQRIGHWHDAFRNLVKLEIARPISVEHMFDVISNLLYGTMFTNFFMGHERSCEDQARDILDVFYNGILQERRLNEQDQSDPRHQQPQTDESISDKESS
jgi:AcrR family transcriptional regulator